MDERMKNIIDRFPVVAHRGCFDRRAPENSVKAIERASRNGLPVEIDVHLLCDGAVAVHHDSSLFRVCHRFGKLENMRTEDLKKCRLGFTSCTLPTFKEVLAAIDGKVPIYIELKCRGNEIELSDALIRELDGYKGEYVFIGFYPKAGAYLKGKGYLVGYSCAAPPKSLPYDADCMICNIVGVPESAEERSKYPPFVPWTISSPSRKAKAKRVSDAAIYNTRRFAEFKPMHK